MLHIHAAPPLNDPMTTLWGSASQKLKQPHAQINAEDRKSWSRLWDQAIVSGFDYLMRHNQDLLQLAALCAHHRITIQSGNNVRAATIIRSMIEKMISAKSPHVGLACQTFYLFCVVAFQKEEAFLKAFPVLCHKNIEKVTVFQVRQSILQQRLIPPCDKTLAKSLIKNILNVKNRNERAMCDHFAKAGIFYGYFDSNSSIDDVSDFMHLFAVPLLKQALKSKLYNLALCIEESFYSNWLRKTENERHYLDTYPLWASATEEAGLSVRQAMGPPTPKINDTDKPLIGIFVHTASTLAHVASLYKVMKGLPAGSERPYRIKIYAFDGYDEHMADMFEGVDVEVYFHSQAMKTDMYTLYDKLSALKKVMEKDGVQVMVWICLMTYSGMAFGMGFAPYQIYWSFKYPVGAYSLPDRRISMYGLSDKKEINGAVWDKVPLVFDKGPPVDEENLKPLKARYKKYDLVLGIMAREDKIKPKHYLNLIISLLKKNKNVVFLYTGSKHLQEIQKAFIDAGVEDRAQFIGWVDTATYAHVIDIFIDSWPARAGLTAFQSLEAGGIYTCTRCEQGYIDDVYLAYSAVVDEDSNTIQLYENDFDSQYDSLDNGKRFFPVSLSPDRYEEMVQHLIDKPDLRKKLGALNKKLAASMSDQSTAGSALNGIFLDSLEEVGKQKGHA